MKLSVRHLAELVQGRIEGDAELLIDAARPVHEAKPGQITFLENEKHFSKLQASRASAAVVTADTPALDKTLIRVADPFAAFVVIAQCFHTNREVPPTGIDPRAVVDTTARVGAEPTIAAFATVGAGTTIGARCRIHSGVAIGRDCILGDDVVLHPHAVLYDGTILGDRVVIHANAVLGADGFGYRFQQGRHVKVPQLGNVEVGSDVEIGAGTTIDRGTFGATRIGAGTKIDNLVMVAHNCQIGEHVILVSQVGVAGSCTIDNHAVLAGQVGLADHLHIGAGAQIGAKAGVMRDVPAGAKVIGAPARPDREQFRIFAAIEKTPELVKDMQRVKRHLGLEDEPAKRAG